MKWHVQLVRLVILAAATIVLFLLLLQTRLMYYPRPYTTDALEQNEKHGALQIELKTSQGRQVAFYLPARQVEVAEPQCLWLVFGGNGSLALDYVEATRSWDARFAYVFVDYPGYGLCEGAPNPARIEESVQQLAEALQQRFGWSESEFRRRTGVLGHSLGSAAALIAAELLRLPRAVLCAPFTSMTDMARELFGWPLCHLTRHRYDNVARLAGLPSDVHIHVFHGVQDEVIPVSMSRRLAHQFPRFLQLHEIPEAMHNDIVLLAGQQISAAMRELMADP